MSRIGAGQNRAHLKPRRVFQASYAGRPRAGKFLARHLKVVNASVPELLSTGPLGTSRLTKWLREGLFLLFVVLGNIVTGARQEVPHGCDKHNGRHSPSYRKCAVAREDHTGKRQYTHVETVGSEVFILGKQAADAVLDS